MNSFIRALLGLPNTNDHARASLQDTIAPASLGFCGECGSPIEEIVRPAPMSRNSEMWRVRQCSKSKSPLGGHDWDVIDRWEGGPKFDRKTGAPLR